MKSFCHGFHCYGASDVDFATSTAPTAAVLLLNDLAKTEEALYENSIALHLAISEL